MSKTPAQILLGLTLLAGCVSPATPAPTATVSDSPTAIVASPTAEVLPPKVGVGQRWIEVDLAGQMVRLREGEHVLAELPASSGVAISAATTTYPGVYKVQQMIKGPIENVPGVFVADILIYDLRAGVGIHSMPMDEAGKVTASTLGRPSSGGCVRVGDSSAVFEFARLGTTIWIH